MPSEPRLRAPTAFSVATVLLRVITAVGLAVDARVHLKLAPAYDAIKSSTVSQGELFRIEAWLAIAAAVLVLVPGRRIVSLIAVLVAGGGLVPLLVYRYFDIGAIGPLPPMYEPVWYPDKTHTLIAQAVATVAALALGAILVVRARRQA